MKSLLRSVTALASVAAMRGNPAEAAVIHFVPSDPIVSADRAGLRDLPLDLNNDGDVDFIVDNDGFAVEFEQQQNNRISSLEDVSGGFAVAEGALIGAIFEPPGAWQAALVVSPSFRIGTDVHACSGGFCVGDFSGREALLGLEFDISGSTHYGWARLIGDRLFVRLEVLDWAYETEPGKPIIAGAIPEPGAVSLIGLAAVLVAMRRRRGSSGSSPVL